MKKLVFALALLLSACSTEAHEEALRYGSYKLADSSAGVPEILVLHEDGKLNAKVVNRIMGSYVLGANNTISVNPGASTMMMGPAAAMAAERQFMLMLAQVKSYKMQGKKLILTTADGQDFVFEPYTESDN